jgi:hypothetical protein
LARALSVDAFEDENFITKYLKFCQNFAKDVVSSGRQKRRSNVYEPVRKLFCQNDQSKKQIFE